MDPWYFLDLSLVDCSEDLNDYSDVHPFGHWIINTEGTENNLLYEGVKYDRVEYNNDNKLCSFYVGNVIKLQKKITFTMQEDKSFLNKFVDVVEKFKLNMSNGAYIGLMETLQKEYNK